MILTGQCSDIDRALLKIDEVASSQDGIAVEEGLVLRGYVAVRLKLGHDSMINRPQLGQLEVYMDILERLNAAIAFKSSDADSRDMVHSLFASFMFPLIIFSRHD